MDFKIGDRVLYHDKEYTIGMITGDGFAYMFDEKYFNVAHVNNLRLAPLPTEINENEFESLFRE